MFLFFLIYIYIYKFEKLAAVSDIGQRVTFHKKTSNTLKLLQAEPFYVIIDLCITFQIKKEVVHEISQSNQILDSFISRLWFSQEKYETAFNYVP